MKETSLVTIETHQNTVLLTLIRAKALNALNQGILSELDTFFNQDLTAYHGVIITGAGDKAFAAGADIHEFKGMSAEDGAQLSARGKEVFNKIEQCPIPVIAAVNGFALGGGCELAMACHLIVASENAKFGQPEVNLGLIPGYDGIKRLIQRIGKSRATEYLLTGGMISAQDALKWGLVSYVVALGEEVTKAQELINKIATKGPRSIDKVLQCIQTYYTPQVHVSSKETQLFGEAIASQEAKEGTSAFLEKRKPIFRSA